jgi:hypothetical protein
MAVRNQQEVMWIELAVRSISSCLAISQLKSCEYYSVVSYISTAYDMREIMWYASHTSTSSLFSVRRLSSRKLIAYVVLRSLA